MKKGFTLVELLVVIAIIGILSILIVPSILSINSNINERLLATKKEDISSSAELYANNNEEIFNGTTEAYIFVYELVDANYITVDSKVGNDKCTSETAKTTKGCVIDPVSKESMNEDYVILTKEGAGVSSEYVSKNGTGNGSSSYADTLVNAVCNMFEKRPGNAYNSRSEVVECKCGEPNDTNGNPTKIVDKDGNEISGANACLLSGTDVNNHLRYGNTNSNKPNWRVLGVYKVDGHLTPKMITSGAV